MSHLKAQNSEAAGVVRGRDDRDHVGAFGDVLIVELDGHLVVTCADRKFPSFQRLREVVPEKVFASSPRASMPSRRPCPPPRPWLPGRGWASLLF